jgi:endogenous inhibitor of DNA gyrase (YacG/DUF329 family)
VDRSKHARIYSLVLDPSDKVAAVLIAAIDAYLTIQAAEKPKSADQQYGATCPYCGTEFAADTERRARMALSAHVRQIHHREWLAEWKR